MHMKSNSIDRGYRYIAYLTAIVVGVYLLDAMIQNRLVEFGSFYVCAAIFVFPFAHCCSDLVAEVYGYGQARQLIWCGLAAWLVTGLIVYIVVKMPYPVFWTPYSKAFNITMSPYLRTVCSGFIAIFIAEFVNIIILVKFKILLRGRFFVLRYLGASLISDVLAIAISLLGFFIGRTSVMHIIGLIMHEFIIGVVIQVMMAMPLKWFAISLKKAENIDHDLLQTNFNPFKVGLD